MDIKLRARLSAYSKVDSINGSCDMDPITKGQIDSLFGDDTSSIVPPPAYVDPNVVSHAQIDSLFKK